MKKNNNNQPFTERIFSINCSPITPELDRLKGLRTRLMLPEALIIAIWSLPPANPSVQFLTLEYFLLFEWKEIHIDLHLCIL